MFGIQGSGSSKPLTPQEKKEYQKAYEKGHDLFKKALEAYGCAGSNPHKKEKLKQVMDETLNVMQETTRAYLREGKKGGGDQKKLLQDYQEYIENPSKENRVKLMEDVDHLKNF